MTKLLQQSPLVERVAATTHATDGRRRPEEPERVQGAARPLDQFVLVLPDRGIADLVLLELLAALLERPDAIGPVVLELGVLGADGEGMAGPSQARDREVVVQG